MLWSRRSVFLGILLGGPVRAGLRRPAFSRRATRFGALQVNGARVGGAAVFGMMIWLLYIRFIVPVLGVFYGTSLIADEVDDKTITYLFTRPIPRAAVLARQVPGVSGLHGAARAAVGDARVLPDRADRRRRHRRGFPSLLKDFGMLAVGLAAYGAVFALVGARLKRPLVVGPGVRVRVGAGR